LRDSLHTLIYATVLGTVCAVLLTGAAALTAPYRRSNARAERIRNVLGVLGVPFDARAGSGELVRLYEENIRQQRLDGLDVYAYVPRGTDEVRAVAVPFAGPGLWGPIKGLLSLEADWKTIRGIRFYEQEETPGLGGEIASERFCKQFTGKRIVGPDGTYGFRIRRGGAVALNEVDAITGATMTCRKVQDMLNEVIRRIGELRAKDEH